MHELSLVQEVIRILEKSAAENNISNIKKIKIVVGKLVAVLPEAMQFCFNALAKEPPFVNARLEIEEIDTLGRCNGCGSEFIIDHNQFCCPGCGSPSINISAGNEFFVDYYEGE